MNLELNGKQFTLRCDILALDRAKSLSGIELTKLDDDGEPDARMFCVLRGKIGLIKLVSPNIAKEQEALEAQQEKFAVEQAKLAIAAKGGARP